MVVGLVLGFVIIAIPLGMHFSNKDKTFYAYFSGESLSGLEEGAQVKFHGVPIGKIARISYDPQNLTRVKAEMRIQEKFPMKKDMCAQTGAVGITGLKYVEILGGTNAAPLLNAHGEIPTKPSVFSAITGKAEMIIGKLELLLNHLNQITEPDSLHSVKTILSNVSAITGDFRSYFNQLNPDLQNITGSAVHLFARLDSISLDVKKISAAFDQSISKEKIAGILGSADSATRSIKTLSETMTLMVRQSQEDISASLQNLREALENANSLMQELSENPSLILRNEQQKEREIK
jgi:phospholipid/cholesterol/gamma-HCH transport system substrate-binding protein